MFHWLRILLLALMLPAAAFAQPVDAISVQDTASPNADTFGLDSTRFPHVSFAGSAPQTIAGLLSAIPSPLGTGVAKEMLVAILTMPVYPDSASAIPPGWFLLRLDKLIRLAAYEDALRLVSSLPENMLDDQLSRRYVDLALTSGDAETACKQASARLADAATPVDAYWSLRRAFCHRLAGENDQAELVLGIFAEQYPGQQALATSLLTGWGDEKSLLPPFVPADGESIPLLIASLKHAKESKTAARLGASFITAEQATSLAPALAVALSEQTVFSTPLRIAFAEHAVNAGAGQPEALRNLYEMVKPEDALTAERRTLATLLADIKATQSADNKVSTVANALQAFKHSLNPFIARKLLAKELDTFSSALGSYPLTPELALDLAAYNFERGNVQTVREIKSYLERYATGNEAIGIALAAVNEALALDSLTHGEATPSPMLPEFKNGQRASLLWMLQRLVTVKQTLGTEIPAATATLSFTAPLAASASPDSALLVALQNAENQSLSGELVLRSVQLLNEGKLAYVSDAVLARLLGALRKSGQDAFAMALARDAILNPPVEALGVATQVMP